MHHELFKCAFTIFFCAVFPTGCCCSTPVKTKPAPDPSAELAAELESVSARFTSGAEVYNALISPGADRCHFPVLNKISSGGKDEVPLLIGLLDDRRPTHLIYTFDTTTGEPADPQAIPVGVLAEFCLYRGILGVYPKRHSHDAAMCIQPDQKEAIAVKRAWIDWWQRNGDRPESQWTDFYDLP